MKTGSQATPLRIQCSADNLASYHFLNHFHLNVCSQLTIFYSAKATFVCWHFPVSRCCMFLNWLLHLQCYILSFDEKPIVGDGFRNCDWCFTVIGVLRLTSLCSPKLVRCLHIITCCCAHSVSEQGKSLAVISA